MGAVSSLSLTRILILLFIFLFLPWAFIRGRSCVLCWISQYTKGKCEGAELALYSQQTMGEKNYDGSAVPKHQRLTWTTAFTLCQIICNKLGFALKVRDGLSITISSVITLLFLLSLNHIVILTGTSHFHRFKSIIGPACGHYFNLVSVLCGPTITTVSPTKIRPPQKLTASR